jgi:D-xylose transport system permease protein
MFNQIMTAFRKNLRSYVMIIALVVLWLGFGIAQPNYLSADHIQDIFMQMAIVAIMACGMVFVIVTGGIDLSVGFGAGFVSVVAAAFLRYGVFEKPLGALGLSGTPLEVVIALIVVVLCIGMGALIGVLQGSIIAFLMVPPFITTLGGFNMWKSGILLVTGGKSLFISSNGTYKFIAQGRIPQAAGLIIAIIAAVIMVILVFRGRARKQKYGIQVGNLVWDLVRTGIFIVLLFAYVFIVNDASVPGVPFLVLVLAAVAILMNYISTNTRFGRYAYAIGGNREAARLSGINIKKSLFSVYVTMGALMGVSGVALAAYVGSGTTAAGSGYELDVIASCILGGCSPLGGEGTVFGAIVGALIMQSLTNGLQMLNVSSNLQYMIKGIVLILAVWADMTMKKKKA